MVPIVQVAHPGQYLQEVEIGARLVSGAGRGYGAMPVVAERGKIGLPVICRNPDEYAEYFGAPVSNFFGYDAMIGYFSRAKAPLIVVRVGHFATGSSGDAYTDTYASVDFEDGLSNVLGAMKGSSEGAWANGAEVKFTLDTVNVPTALDTETYTAPTKVLIVDKPDAFARGDHVKVASGAGTDYRVVEGVDETSGAITLNAETSTTPSGTITLTRLTFTASVRFRNTWANAEIYPNLSMSKESAKYVFAILSSDNYGLNSASKNVTATPSTDFLTNYDTLISGLTDCRPTGDQIVSLVGGTDSKNSLTSEDFVGQSASEPIGAALFKNIAEAKLICSVDHWGIATPNNEQVYRALVDIARTKRFGWAGGDLSENATKKNTGVTGCAFYECQNTINYKDMFGGLYYPWIQVSSVKTGRATFIPCIADVMGRITENDELRGISKAPAGEEVSFSRILALKWNVTDEDQDELNPIGVNCLRNFPGVGIVIWGARTQSNNPKWRYINVRRYQSYIEESVMLGTRWAAFEPNDNDLRTSVRDSVSNFLLRLCKAGTLASKNPSEAYVVRCDDTNNTNDTIDEGRFIIDVGVAHSKPAEFLIYRFTQTRRGAQVEQIQQIT